MCILNCKGLCLNQYLIKPNYVPFIFQGKHHWKFLRSWTNNNSMIPRAQQSVWGFARPPGHCLACCGLRGCKVQIMSHSIFMHMRKPAQRFGSWTQTGATETVLPEKCQNMASGLRKIKKFIGLMPLITMTCPSPIRAGSCTTSGTSILHCYKLRWRAGVWSK